jgi:hypothetical protein
MTREQEARTVELARQARGVDLLTERERSEARAAWWVAELSYELGIVDAHGMVDVDGEIARRFKLAFKRMRYS